MNRFANAATTLHARASLRFDRIMLRFSNYDSRRVSSGIAIFAVRFSLDFVCCFSCLRLRCPQAFEIMKIGIARFNLTASGGAERYALNLIRALVEAGHEPHVFTARLPPDFPQGAVAHLFRAPLRRRSGKSLLPRFLRPKAFRRWLRSELGSCPLDLLFVTEPIWPNDVFRAGGGVHREWLQIVARETSGPLAPLQRFWTHRAPFDRAALRDEKQLFQAAHTGLVICNSQMVAGEITRHYDYPSQRIRVVPNGVDSQFQPATPDLRQALRLERGLQTDDLALLFVGSGLWRKGLDRAIDIVAALRDEGAKRAANTKTPAPNLRFFVVGHGALDVYRRQVKALNLEDQVIFVGGKGHGEVLEWYQAADLFLFPTRYDPFANACLEANACGLPVVTTARNGFSEHIEKDVNGIVLQAPQDARAAALAIADLIKNKPSRQTVRESVAHLSLENHIALLLDAIQSTKSTDVKKPES